MAKKIFVQAALVIFSCLVIVQYVHTVPNYYKLKPCKPSQFALCYDLYQACEHGICSNSTDYPQKEILEVMRNTKNMLGFFGTVLNSSFDSTQTDSRTGFPEPKTKGLCRTHPKQTYQPQVLRSADKIWRFVVNVEGFIQRFTAEICRSGTDTTYNDFCTEYRYKCKQNYQELYLLTYENKTIDFVKFEIPTTCNCDCNGTSNSNSYLYKENLLSHSST